MPDFTNCKRLLGNAYAGANGKKIGIEYQGEQYMLKFPPSGMVKRTELSYTNSRPPSRAARGNCTYRLSQNRT